MAKKQPVQNIPDFTKDAVNSVDSWFDSNYCALISWGGWVRLFNITEQRFVIDLFTHKDSGGVSVAMSSDDRHCFLGTYYSWGLACFDVSTGQMVWKRDDLKRFYGLAFSKAQQCLFGYFDGKSALRIDPKTGETIETFKTVKNISASPFDDAVLFGDGHRFTLRKSDGEKIWSVPRESFAVLNIAWSPETVAISEVGSERRDGTKAGIRCFSLHGKLLWRYEGRKHHVSPIMYKPSSHQYVGVDFTAGVSDAILVHWDEQTGQIHHEQAMSFNMPVEICRQGQMMFCVNRKSYEFALNPIS
jgi:outer membrane protein assembly factor BamB